LFGPERLTSIIEEVAEVVIKVKIEEVVDVAEVDEAGVFGSASRR
jgi:hypothetical protein